MNNIVRSAGNAVVSRRSLEIQVNLFLFDLKNEAKEHGFKPDESWTVELVTDQELAWLKRVHHPVVSLHLHSPGLLTAYKDIKNKLRQSLSSADAALTDSSLISDQKRQLAAYPDRHTR